MGKRFDKEFKTQACAWRRSQATPILKLNAILASANELSVNGNAKYAKTVTKHSQVKDASKSTTMKCGVSSVKTNACAGSVTS